MQRSLRERLGAWLGDETGQMLIWTLIVTVAGGLIIGAFLVYASTSLLTSAGGGDQVRIYYTADAGAERCLVSLTVADDGCSFTLSLNGYTATVTISGPLTDTSPISATSAPRYLATGLEGATLAAGASWLLELSSRPVTIVVNWPFTPADKAWEIWVYSGTMGGPVVVTATGTASPARIEVPPGVMTDGVYTIRFYNSSVAGTVAASFVVSPTPVLSYTWVWANAYQDYIITSTVDGTGTVLEVIARQTPGSSLITNPITVEVKSWQFR